MSTCEVMQPHRQFFQIRFIHSGHKLLTVNIMNRQNVIFVKDDPVSLIQVMEPSFCQRIVHNALKVVAGAF